METQEEQEYESSTTESRIADALRHHADDVRHARYEISEAKRKHKSVAHDYRVHGPETQAKVGERIHRMAAQPDQAIERLADRLASGELHIRTDLFTLPEIEITIECGVFDNDGNNVGAVELSGLPETFSDHAYDMGAEGLLEEILADGAWIDTVELGEAF